jgi:hypothetical protein
MKRVGMTQAFGGVLTGLVGGSVDGDLVGGGLEDKAWT